MVQRMQTTLLKTHPGSFIVQAIRDRVLKYNKNFMAIFVGATGNGKSYSALRLAEKIDPSFTIERVVFTIKDFFSLLNSSKLKRGNVIIIDEAGTSIPSREWYQATNKMFNAIAQTFRHLNLIVFYTTPHFSFIDSQTRKLLHCLIQPENINHQEKYCMAKIYLLQANPELQTIYRHKFKQFDPLTGETRSIRRIKINLPSKELRESYERKKTAFTRALNLEAEKNLTKLPVRITDNKELSTYEDKLKDDYLNKGKSIRNLAEEYGRSTRTINNHLDIISAKVGYDIKGTKRIRGKQFEKLKKKVLKGMNIKGFTPKPEFKIRKRDPTD